MFDINQNVYINAGQRLIASKYIYFFYIIYVCVLCILCIYKDTHIQYILKIFTCTVFTFIYLYYI